MAADQQYILMLEDDGDDRHITETFFAEQHHDIGLKFFTHPHAIMPYLDECLNMALHLPSLIVLDNYVPAGSGIEVLRAIKSHPAFQTLPVIIVSGSDKERDIQDCYQSGANSYIVKPDRSASTQNKIATFIKYWFEVVELPKANAGAMIQEQLS